MFQKIEQINQTKTAAKNNLNKLLATPFNASPEQITQLNILVDDFELKVHRMLLYKCMQQAFTIWANTTVASWLLPVPEFIKSLTTTAFYMGIIGFCLKNFQIDSLAEDVEKMRLVYIWCIKDPNPDVLNHSSLPRLLLCLTPYCKKEFLQFNFNKKVNFNDTEDKQKNSFSKFISGMFTHDSIVHAHEPLYTLNHMLEKLRKNELSLDKDFLQATMAYFSKPGNFIKLTKNIPTSLKQIVSEVIKANIGLVLASWQKFNEEKSTNQQDANI